MKSHNDVKAEFDSSGGNWINLEKLAGKKIKEVQGYISTEFDSESPCFQLFRIIFEDDSSSFCEGEHDIAYLPKIPGVSDKEILNVYKTNPDYDPSEDQEEDEE